MFVLEPIFHKTIWGGNRLVDVYGEQAIGLGHLYSLRCRDGDSSIILNGVYKGIRLFDVIGEYPLSLAMVDAALDLSIQVHPGGDIAKYESYFFIEAPISGHIYGGINDMASEKIRMAAEDGSILSHVKRIMIKNSDYVIIEPRTVHALTAGSFVYEIEQGDDNTYRLFDYNRKGPDGNQRDLQVEQAIDSLDMSVKVVPRRYETSKEITEKTYSTRLFSKLSVYSNDTPGIECLTLIAGNATIDNVPIKAGMTVVIEPGEKIERLAIECCIAARLMI